MPYAEITHWHADANYDVALELHFTRAEVSQYLRGQMYMLSKINGRL